MRFKSSIATFLIASCCASVLAATPAPCPWLADPDPYAQQPDLARLARDRAVIDVLPPEQRVTRWQAQLQIYRTEGNRRLEGLAGLILGRMLADDQPEAALSCLDDPAVFRHTALADLALETALEIVRNHPQLSGRVDTMLSAPERAGALDFRLLSQVVESHRLNGRLVEARRWLTMADPSVIPGIRADWHLFTLGRLDLAEGRLEAAKAHWRAALRVADPDPAVFLAALGELKQAEGSDPLPGLLAAPEAVRIARGFLARGSGRAAWACLAGYLPNQAPTAAADPFWRTAGEAALQTGQYRQARELLRRFQPRAADDRLARAYALAVAGKKLGRTDDYKRNLALIRQSAPRSDEHIRLLQPAAFDAEVAGRTDDVRRLYGEIARLSQRRPDVAEASWKLAWIEYLHRKWARADALFRRAVELDDGREFALAGLYWHGVCARRMKQIAEADAAHRAVLEVFPFSYYAELVRQGWGGPPPTDPDAAHAAEGWSRMLREKYTPIRAAEPDQPLEMLSPPDRFFVLEALAAGLRKPAVQRLDTANRTLRDPWLHALLAGLAAEDGRTYDLIWHAHRACSELYTLRVEDASPECWHMLFPVRYEEILKRELADTGVDPYLALALIRQESAFLEDARSVSDAIGLMQLLPATAAEEAGFRGDPAELVSRLKTPEFNLPLGCRYLVKQYRYFDRKMALALAAYNGGPRRIRDVNRRYETKCGLPEIVELIPMAQSRNYVKAIYRNWNYYSRLYAGRPADLAWLFGQSESRRNNSAIK
ncbi:MAG TPA: transglycosylase SLT domain-containing protein [Acidobacteriota bacterium]|nr:transglycosylase SLT domain-containing protein [Acidobacteriota bacterium]HQF88261.1 transglycosylase SLT domain-containing protein [Acidobacteriota bacterium]HQG92398.1 transglycosylase SLT domain-containing protein [Acidobacteriota bacterium]HQK86104.1 transglycosylase SLT domain-containing protein [Acidobacteriota bacterium]